MERKPTFYKATGHKKRCLPCGKHPYCLFFYDYYAIAKRC